MKPEKKIRVHLMTPDGVLFEGEVHHGIVCPGEKGVFEVLPQHKPLVSRLIAGRIVVDQSRVFEIKRGIVRVGLNAVTAIVETQAKKQPKRSERV